MVRGVRATSTDREAFDRLAAPLRRELHVHCYRMLGSVHDADDAVQESLLRAWRSLGKLHDHSGFRPWLYKIATNRCLTMIETRRRRELPVDLSPASPTTEIAWLEPYPDAHLDIPQTPEARYETREAIELAFIATLQRLPGQQRATLVLRDVLGFTAKETAGLLNIGVAAANSALQRARATVRQHLPTHSQQNELRALGDTDTRALAQRYATAWEDGDVDAIVAMLSSDAKYSMPPLPEWYAGRTDIRTFIVEGPLSWRWRYLPTTANGQLAFGTYLWDADRAVYTALSVDVLTLRGTEVVEVVSFLTADIFAGFGLPDEVPEILAPGR